MIDVFLCSCAADPIRKGLFDAVRSRWLQEGGITLHAVVQREPGLFESAVLAGGDCETTALFFSRKEFQGERRKLAEECATGEIYILAEDDCMPLGSSFVKRGLEVMMRHPEYAVLSPLLLPFPPPINENEGEVSNGITAGGINFTRRGLIDIAQINSRLPWDECAQAEHLREKGWKSGWMRDVKCNHIGATLSTLWPQPYTGVTSINDA